MKTTVLAFLGAMACLTFDPVAAQDADTREGGLTGTGIVGIVTELGSFYVNEQRITYPPEAVVQTALGQQPANSLLPGDTVAALVNLSDNEWVADQIRQTHPIIGPISVIKADTLTIMGTRVDVAGIPELDIAIGDWVAVGGLWRSSDVVASRLVKITPQEQGHIFGTYLGRSEVDSFEVGGSQITGILPRHAEYGDVLAISGHPSELGLEAQSIDLGLFEAKAGVVLVQGYLSQPDQTGRYTLLGSGLTSFTSQPEMIVERQLMTTCGAGRSLLSDDTVISEALGVRLELLECMP